MRTSTFRNFPTRAALCAFALLAAVLIAAPAAQAQCTTDYSRTCWNSGTPTIYGTNCADFLVGTSGFDRITGSYGNDLIYGGGGNDELCGDWGRDSIYGQDGNDRINGDNDDIANTGAADTSLGDWLYGGGGYDTMNGQVGPDEMWGGTHDDFMQGAWDDDCLDGEGGTDQVEGNWGYFDECYGETLVQCEIASYPAGC